MRDRKKIVTALNALLTPVARFCLRHGLKVQDVEKTFKAVFLQAAKSELANSGNPVNKSTLSAATGVARKFVTEYSTFNLEDGTDSNLLTKIVGHWQNSALYQNSRGQPRLLGAEGADSEFSNLVKSVTMDLNSYTVLAEMLRLGIISKEGNQVKLLSRINLLKKLPDAMKFVGEDFDNLQRAAEENILGDAPIHLHLTTRYDNVSASAKEVIQNWLIKEGSAFHKKARAFLSKYDRDISPNPKDKNPSRLKVSLSAFSYLEENTKRVRGITKEPK